MIKIKIKRIVIIFSTTRMIDLATQILTNWDIHIVYNYTMHIYKSILYDPFSHWQLKVEFEIIQLGITFAYRVPTSLFYKPNKT